MRLSKLFERGEADWWWQADGLIAVMVLLAYWPLTSFGWSLSPGDTLDCWLPWRHFMTQALGEGRLPLWDPYQQGGYPFYADLQGPAWYVEALAIGGTIGHSLYTLQCLFLLYVIIGGWGMRRFAREVTGSDAAGLLAGIAYALSGFFTAHTQHFYSVISAAWMPWLLWSHLRLLQRPDLRGMLRTAVVASLLLTGGNHTFSIMVVYLMAALLVQHLVRADRKGRRAIIMRPLGAHVAVIMSAALMACGTLWSALEVWPHLTRARGLGYALASHNPLHWKALVTLVAPYAGFGGLSAPPLDPAMTSAWLGVIPLLGLALSFRSRRSPVEKILLAFALLCALASLGDLLPLYRWLHDFVPGMSLFRFPNYFWLFVILGVLPTACVTLVKMAADLERSRRSLLIMTGVVAGAVACLLVAAFIRHAGSNWELFVDHATLLQRMTAPGLAERIIWSAMITLLVLVTFGVLAWKRRLRLRWILLLLAVELLAGVQFCQWTTSLFDHPVAAIQERIDGQAAGPVVPELLPMNDDNAGAREMHLLWRNTHDFLARPSHEGFNSFWLADHDSLMTQHPEVFASLGHSPWVSFMDSASAGSIEPLAFDHQGFTVRARSIGRQFLRVQQNPYPGWTMTIDGIDAAIARMDFACLGTILPGGDHLVTARFQKPWAAPLFAVSMLSFFSALIFLVLGFPSGQRAVAMTFTLVLAAAVAWPFLVNKPKAERILATLPELRENVQRAQEEHRRVIINTDRAAALREELAVEDLSYLRCAGTDAQSRMFEALGDSLPQRLLWTDAGLDAPAEVRAFLLANYHLAGSEHLGRDVELHFLDRKPAEAPTVLHREAFDPPLVLAPSGTAWSPAYHAEVAGLRRRKGDFLVIEATCRTFRAHQPVDLVLEQKRGEVTIDYDAMPASLDGAEWRQLRMARSLDRSIDPACTIGAYVMATGDTLEVRELTVTLASIANW